VKVYLAGPMRGYKDFNFPAFITGAIALRARGHEVFCPAEHDLDAGLNPAGDGSEESLSDQGFSMRAALGVDLTWITKEAEAVVVLPGWAKSLGALAEAFTAWCLGIPVFPIHPFLDWADSAPQLTPEDLDA
jgi:hypothetical protein